MFRYLFFLMLFVGQTLSATIYLEPPENFKPKVEVAAVFIEDGDKILFLHRQDGKRHGNTWAIPGGKLERGETPIQAAIRETFEETGFDFSKQKVEWLKTVYIQFPGNDHFIYHIFKTRLEGYSPTDVKISSKEHKGFTWVTPQDSLKMELMPDEAPCIKLVYFPNS